MKIKKAFAVAFVILLTFCLTAIAQDSTVALPKEVTLKGFPNLHPLVIHFPIALILVAVPFQLLLLFQSKNKMLQWLTFALMAGGFIGAFLACKVFAPHISSDAPDEIFNTFKLHHRFAGFTFWAILATAALRLWANLWLKNKWFEILILFCIITAAVFVSIAGHLGAGLTHNLRSRCAGERYLI